MKKILALMCMICTFLCVCMVNPIGADTNDEGIQTVCAADSAFLEAGNEVMVKVTLKNCVPVKSMGLSLEYDKDVFQLVSGEWLRKDAIIGAFDSTNEKAALAYSSAADINGEVFQFTLKVKEGVKAGVTKLRVVSIIKDTNQQDVECIDQWLELSISGEPEECKHDSMQEVPAVAADCENEGNHQYYICMECNQVFKADGITPTTISEEIIPALGHDWSEKIEDEAHMVSGSGMNCQTAVEYYFDCANCDAIGTTTFEGEVKGPHQVSPAWTIENGRHFHACMVEGCDYKEDEAECSGGSATCISQAICVICNTPYGNLGEHAYKAEWAEGDANGHWHECERCGAHDAVVQHTPNIPEATEKEAKVCTECGYLIQPQLGHTHKVILVEGYDADCTNSGKKAYYVCECGKQFKDLTANVEILDKLEIEIPALGHSWADRLEEKYLKEAASNCAEYNLYWVSCSRCGEASSEDYFTSEIAGPHKISAEWRQDNGKHFHVCEVEGCTYRIDEGECVPSEETNEKGEKICSVCGNAIASEVEDSEQQEESSKQESQPAEEQSRPQEEDSQPEKEQSQTQEEQSQPEKEQSQVQEEQSQPVTDKSGNSETSPKTGDNSNSVLWGVTAIVCVVILIAIFGSVQRKRRILR